jgi:peptidoglycan LD-endopeptidase LytH
MRWCVLAMSCLVYAASEDAALQISLPLNGLTIADIHDMFDQVRDGNRRHEATDIMAPRGTPVLAVNDGTIVKLFLSKPGGNTIYQFDPSKEYCYYYAHLDSYASGIVEGRVVHRGELIGFVGSTGNANPAAPHLHFEIHKLDSEKRWYTGSPINPYPYLVLALKSQKR